MLDGEFTNFAPQLYTMKLGTVAPNLIDIPMNDHG